MMQVNYKPYIPALSAPAAYGAGYLISHSRVAAGLLSTAVIVNTAFIRAQSFGLMDKYAREIKLKEGIWDSAQFFFVAVAISICDENFSPTLSVSLLVISIPFIFLMLIYQDYFICLNNLKCIIEPHLESVKTLFREINELKSDQKTKDFHLEFLNGIEGELKNLMNLDLKTGPLRYQELCSRVISLQKWIDKEKRKSLTA